LRGVQVAAADGIGHVHNDLSCVLLRSLAAHSLRGVPHAERCDERGRSDRDVAACDPAATCDAAFATGGYEQSVDTSARSRSTPTACSATTAAYTSSRRLPGSVDAGYAMNLSVPVNV